MLRRPSERSGREPSWRNGGGGSQRRPAALKSDQTSEGAMFQPSTGVTRPGDGGSSHADTLPCDRDTERHVGVVVWARGAAAPHAASARPGDGRGFFKEKGAGPPGDDWRSSGTGWAHAGRSSSPRQNLGWFSNVGGRAEPLPTAFWLRADLT